MLLVLKAFSAGCSALTGVEAIANGVPLFKEPRVMRAKRTELLLGLILGRHAPRTGRAGRPLAHRPRSGQTVLSQIMGEAVGRHWAYYIVSLTITLVLALAANTSFGGLPVLASLLARDNYLPHLFALRGDRQVFGNGIWVLTVLSGVLLVVVGGNTDTLIPLFAIGVFIGFTCPRPAWSCTGAGPARQAGAARPSNGTGAVVTAVGHRGLPADRSSPRVPGWWSSPSPPFIFLFNRIHALLPTGRRRSRYRVRCRASPRGKRTIVVVPVTNVSRLTQHAMSEALSLGDEVIAVSVVFDGEESEAAESERRASSGAAGTPGSPLRVLHTDYASVVEPIVRVHR